MFEAIAESLADSAGATIGMPTLIAIATLVFGSGGTTVALISALAGRKKNAADATKAIVEAAANLLTPYNTVMEMTTNTIKDYDRRFIAERRERHILEARVDELEEEQERLRLRIEAYERIFGPLPNGST